MIRTIALAALAGLVTALSSMPGARAADTPSYPQGAAAFQTHCAVCHGAAGAGIPALAPPLSSSPARYAASPEGRRQLAITLLYGMFGDITVGQAHFNSQMPDFARLDDTTLAATLNFVVFDLAHAATALKPLAPGEIAGLTYPPLVVESYTMAARLLTLAGALAAGAFGAAVSASPAQDYTLYCMGCHGAQAQGVPGRIPPLAGSVSLFALGAIIAFAIRTVATRSARHPTAAGLQARV